MNIYFGLVFDLTLTMNTDFSLMNTIILVTFYVMVLFSGLLQSGAKSFFQSSHSGWLRSMLSFFAISVPFVLIICFYFGQMFREINYLYLLSINICIILAVYYFVHNKTKYRTIPELIGEKFGPKNRCLVAIFLIITNYGLKLPIIIFTFGWFFNIVFGATSFVILVSLITFTGVLITIRGLPSSIHTGGIIGLSLIIATLILMINSFSKPDAESFLFSHEQVLHAGKLTPNPILYIVMIFIVTGIWIIDTYSHQQLMISRDTGHKTKALYGAGIVLVLLSIFIFTTLKEYGFTNIASPAYVEYIINKLENSGFFLILLSSLFISSLILIFISIAEIVTFDLYKNMKPNSAENALKLVSRLSIVLSVVFTILITPLFPEINLRVIWALVSFYIIVVTPIITIIIAGLIHVKLSENSVGITLVTSWFLGVIAGILISTGILNQAYTVFIVVALFFYSIACLFIIQMLNRKYYTAKLQYNSISK
jgi:SSS family solute:Na+ symporter